MVICQPNVVSWKEFYSSHVIQNASCLKREYSSTYKILFEEIRGGMGLNQDSEKDYRVKNSHYKEESGCIFEYVQLDMVVFYSREEDSSFQDVQHYFFLSLVMQTRRETTLLVVKRQNKSCLLLQSEKKVADVNFLFQGKSDREKNIFLLQNNLAVNISISNISFSRN